MTKKFNCSSVEDLMNELLSVGYQGVELENASDGDTFLEIVQLNAYDSDDLANKPTASAEIICGKDAGAPYCMYIAKDCDNSSNDKGATRGTFDSVFDAVLKELTNSPSIKSNSR